MKNRHVVVVEPDPAWPVAFDAEARRIRAALPGLVSALHHIGSTAVPNISAKPVIDMMLLVPSIDSLDGEGEAFASLGYSALGENGIPGRRYFVRGPEFRTHQVHSFAEGDPNVVRHLAFRDYLRAHPDAAREYGELKARVAKRCARDIDAYCDGKDEFIKHHQALALRWWPGPGA